MDNDRPHVAFVLCLALVACCSNSPSISPDLAYSSSACACAMSMAAVHLATPAFPVQACRKKQDTQSKLQERTTSRQSGARSHSLHWQLPGSALRDAAHFQPAQLDFGSQHQSKLTLVNQHYRMVSSATHCTNSCAFAANLLTRFAIPQSRWCPHIYQSIAQLAIVSCPKRIYFKGLHLVPIALFGGEAIDWYDNFIWNK